MITLTIIIFISTILGWIKRYNNSIKGKYKFSPFEQDPTFSSALLVAFTAYSISTLIFLLIKY